MSKLPYKQGSVKLPVNKNKPTRFAKINLLIKFIGAEYLSCFPLKAFLNTLSVLFSITFSTAFYELLMPYKS